MRHFECHGRIEYHYVESRQLDYGCFDGRAYLFRSGRGNQGISPEGGTKERIAGGLMEVINWKIVASPLNWAILFLMIFIAGIAIHLVLANLPRISAETENQN